MSDNEMRPVAWLRKNGFRFNGEIEPQDDSEVPLYTRPALTDEQVREIQEECAKICEGVAKFRPTTGAGRLIALECAAAIREAIGRGEK